MQYNQEIAEKMLADPRWVGAIQSKMIRVWKTRGVIPNQYFNQKYVKFIKEGREDLANQVKDPYFNESFILRTEITEAEIVEHKRVIETVLRSEKLARATIIKQCNISDNLVQDALRQEGDARRVLLRPEHVLAVKKNLQELRIKMKNLVEKLQNKRHFWERDKEEIDAIINDPRLILSKFIENEKYAGRASQRRRFKGRIFEDEEAAYYIERMAIFLLETAM